MQKRFLIIPILMAIMACSLFNPASSATPAVASTTAPASDESANQTQVINPLPIIYISGTTHIETNLQTWPDMEARSTSAAERTNWRARACWLKQSPTENINIQRSVSP